MAITLADVNKTLQRQNESLDQMADGVQSSSKSLDEFVNYFKDKDTKERLEDKREEERAARAVAAKSQKNNSLDKESGGFAGLSFPQAAGIGGFAALATSIFGSLAKRSIPAVLATIMADEIGNYITSATGSRELGDAAERGIYGGAIGSIFGKKIGLIGFALGAIMDEKVQGELDLLVQDINEQLVLMGLELPTMESITTNIVEGLRGIRAAITGDFNTAEFKENWQEALALIAGVSFMFSPFGTAGLALKALRRLGLLLGAGDPPKPPKKPPPTLPSGIPTTRGHTVPTAPPVDTKALADQIKRSTPDSRGNVLSKNGKVYSATSPQGKQIVAAGEAAKAKMPKVPAPPTPSTPPEDPVDKAKTRNPRFAKLLRVLGKGSALGSIFGAVELAMILNDESLTSKQKWERAGGIFGGIAGFAAGSAAGAVIGGPVGAAILGIGGSIGGRYLGEELMKWLLGEENTIHRPVSRGQMGRGNRPEGYIPSGGYAGYAGDAGDMAAETYMEQPQSINKGIRVELNPDVSSTTDRIRMETEASRAYSRKRGAGAAINSGNTSVTTSNSQPIVMGGGSVLDRNDPFSSMLPTSP